jgi:hypothetical protein
MASNFFSNKARAAALATKPKAGADKDDNTRLQPWVEK